jgi:hypothetical protein
MADSAEVLQRLYLAGFDIKTFDRFPRAIGIRKGDCIALLEPDVKTGVRIIGRPGWRIDDAIGVLTTQAGQPVFQWKDQTVEATPERRKMLQEFERELVAIVESESD